MDDTILATLTYESVNKKLNQQFQLQTEEKTLDSELVEVKLLGQKERADWEIADDEPERSREPFSLVFRTPTEAKLDQGLYQINHNDGALGQVFLTPVAENKGGRYLEAVFT